MADALAALTGAPAVTAGVIGIDLLEEMADRPAVVIVDAIETGRQPPGTVVAFTIDDLTALRNATSPHSLNLPAIIELGRQLGLDLPARIVCYGIEVGAPPEWSESLSAALAAQLPLAVKWIQNQEFPA